MDLKKTILTRRSVRKFTDHYVTNAELRELMEAARFAPSWGNTQIWEYVIVRDYELIGQVTETFSPTNPARKCSANASALIVACAKLNISGCKEGNPGTKFNEWFMFDLGMSVQNICLRAHDLGLGTVVVGAMDHSACEKILEVPAGYAVVAVIPVGKPKEPVPETPARKEFNSFVHLDNFRDLFAAL